MDAFLNANLDGGASDRAGVRVRGRGQRRTAAIEVVSDGARRGRGDRSSARRTAASTSRSSRSAAWPRTRPRSSRSARSRSGSSTGPRPRPRARCRSSPPTFAVVDAGAAAVAAAAAATIDTAEYASRRIVGIVFVVLSFLTLVFYGLWVASGVVAEKASRVMELLISAATAPQLVVGKITGHRAGRADPGARWCWSPRSLMMVLSGQLGNALLGEDPTAATSLAGLSPGLLAAFLVYFVLGFALYASLYAGPARCCRRAEDLQIIALPLSIPAIMGYLPAVLALSGSTSGFIRFASYVPLWSPFVMLSRLAVGRVEPWELALSLGLLIATVPLVALLAIRVYRAGVLLYGQPPTMRTFLRVVRGV